MPNKVKAISICLLSLIIISCSKSLLNSTNNENTESKIEILSKKNQGFNTESLTISYLKRKIDNFIFFDKGAMLVKEVNYAKYKQTPVLAHVLNDNPVTLMNFLNNPGIKNEMEINPPFAAYIESLLNSPASPLNIGLLGYYPFSNNIGNDESGNNRNAIVKPAVSLATDRFGNNNHAIQINDDALDNIVIPGSTDLITGGPLTVSGWANFTFTSGAHHFIAGKHLAGTGNGFFIFAQSKKLGFFVSGSQIQTTNDFNDGSWHHVAGTYDGVTAKLYVDGSFVDQFNTSYTSNNEPMKISWAFGSGKIDNVRFYNRVLSADEINRLNLYDQN
jgi:hypothetical protein